MQGNVCATTHTHTHTHTTANQTKDKPHNKRINTIGQQSWLQQIIPGGRETPQPPLVLMMPSNWVGAMIKLF